jgi:hypothetical protein
MGRNSSPGSVKNFVFSTSSRPALLSTRPPIQRVLGALSPGVMTRRKALERWETKVGSCEVTPQALWPIAKSLLRRDGPKLPTAIHGPLGITYQPNEKTNVIADCLENQFTSHDLCDENHALTDARICKRNPVG